MGAEYTLRAISLQRARTYLVELATKDGKALQTTCNVLRIESDSVAPFDVIQFESDDFNCMCALGQIYIKPIGAAILAFHACIQVED